MNEWGCYRYIAVNSQLVTVTSVYDLNLSISMHALSSLGASGVEARVDELPLDAAPLAGSVARLVLDPFYVHARSLLCQVMADQCMHVLS